MPGALTRFDTQLKTREVSFYHSRSLKATQEKYIVARYLEQLFLSNIKGNLHRDPVTPRLEENKISASRVNPTPVPCVHSEEFMHSRMYKSIMLFVQVGWARQFAGPSAKTNVETHVQRGKNYIVKVMKYKECFLFFPLSFS